MKIGIHRIIAGMAGLLFLTAGLELQEAAAKGRKKEKAKTEATAPRKRLGKYERLFKGKKVETAKGLVTIHKIGNKLYFEFPVDLMDRDFLIGTAVSEVSNNGNVLVGQRATAPLHVKFNQIDSAVYLQEVSYATRLPAYAEEPGMAGAVAASRISPLIQSFKIAAYRPDSTAVVFEVTDLFMGDNRKMDPFDARGRQTEYGRLTRKATLSKPLSYLESFKAFETNLVIRSVLTYHQVISLKNASSRQTEQVTLKVTRSMVLLPDEAERMAWRLADPRVGYQVSAAEYFGTQRDRSLRTYFIHKWNLQPSDKEKTERGELVAPGKPIVFYIDTMFPASWKKAIREGVLVWNKAFEQIGFRGALQVRDFPAHDTLFDPENLIYSCIRYAPAAEEGMRGETWTDPRSGEILSASVFVCHDVIRQINTMRFVQTAQADERVRTPKLPEEVMLESLRGKITHEVGHCLGLTHNMAGSAAFPTDSLRSAAFTWLHGITASVMDEMPYNYVVQPGDKGVKLTVPELGDYDYYAIAIGYRPVMQAHTPQEELREVQSWIHAKASDPACRYGKEQLKNEYDPTALAYDLGDDAVKAGNYGIKNLKYILKHLNSWLEEQDRDYSYRDGIYQAMAEQLAGYLEHALRNVGGYYLNESFSGDARRAFRVVPKEMQRRSAVFVMEQLRTMGWLDAPEVTRNLSVKTPKSQLLVKRFAHELVNTKRVSLGYYRDAQSYSPREYLEDIYKQVWASTLKGKNLSPAERLLQYEVVCAILKKLQLPNHRQGDGRKKKQTTVETLARGINAAEEISGFGRHPLVTNIANDNQAHLWHGLLIRVQKLMESRIAGGGPETRAHYGFLLEKIEDIRNWK